jgi:hypothetical protein
MSGRVRVSQPWRGVRRVLERHEEHALLAALARCDPHALEAQCELVRAQRDCFRFAPGAEGERARMDTIRRAIASSHRSLPPSVALAIIRTALDIPAVADDDVAVRIPFTRSWRQPVGPAKMGGVSSIDDARRELEELGIDLDPPPLPAPPPARDDAELRMLRRRLDELETEARDRPYYYNDGRSALIIHGSWAQPAPQPPPQPLPAPPPIIDAPKVPAHRQEVRRFLDPETLAITVLYADGHCEPVRPSVL